MSPKIVIALDSFKGCLTAQAACQAVADGLLAGNPRTECRLKPMADGGEGTAAALLAARPGGIWIARRVAGPLRSREVEAGFAWFPDDQTAVVEMAAANGLPLLAEHERNPLRTSTLGTGQLLRAAVEQGARRILLAIGGSATNDGGIGAAAALGWRFLDSKGRDVEPVGESLAAIARILPPETQAPLPPVDVLCDVTNPLCGPTGAAAVYGPQKGATPAMVAQLDTGLASLAGIIARDLGRDLRDLPGAGAAGGLGAGAVAFLDAAIRPGIATVAEVSGLPEALRDADACITGEGRFDTQSLQGKVVSGVAAISAHAGVPVTVFAGQVQLDPRAFHSHGIREAHALQGPDLSVSEAIRRAPALLRGLAERWMISSRKATHDPEIPD